ncbi:MAG: aminopeptidase [Bacteroidetes bacterium]|nr:aminopeptidase [Bacteroidota bacterium]
MKSLFLLTIGLSIQVFGQTPTNVEGSSYQFTKVYHLDATPVQSQGKTGTCWSFSGLSFFESELIRKGGQADLLSEMFVVRKSYENKADKFIRMDGKINFGEGGAFHDIPWVIKNHGIVPYEVYNGVNSTDAYDHTEFFEVLNGAMQGLLKALGNNNTISTNWKSGINGLLDAYLGKDIKEFEWKGKKHTPQSYALSIGLNMDEYVSLTSFTNHAPYSKCQLAIPDNYNWGDSYNVGLDDLMSTVENALSAGYTVAWGADVSEKGFSFKNGIALVPADANTIQVSGRDNRTFNDAGADRSSNAFLTPGKEQTITVEVRQKGYDNKTTTDDHGMHIVGLYKDQNGTKYLLVKNSWGTNNYPKGYLYVSEAYFRYKTINIYLNKAGINADLKKRIGLN